MSLLPKIFRALKGEYKKGKELVDDTIDYAEDMADKGKEFVVNTINDTIQWSQEKTIRKLQKEVAPDIPLAHREYLWALTCEKIHDWLPDQKSNTYLQYGFNFCVNTLVPMYKGELKEEQIMSKGDKPFAQSPSMLAYWAKTKANTEPENTLCKSVNLEEYTPGPNEIILAYYPPCARTFLENTSEDVYDNNNKHFYSHCKSELICDDGTKIVSNPELLYNSNSHCGNGKTANIYNPRSKEKIDINVKGYLPEDAITYAIDYTKLGLNKKDVEDGFKFVSADINILDPKIQKSIFALQDNGYTADKIVDLYVNNIDITNKENLDKLTKDKNCDINNLVKKNNEYIYNLQEYNCAVKPVSALVFANECKIRNNKELNPEECRKNLNLPNIYDPERYGCINNDFYKNYIDTLKKEYNKEKNMSLKQNISQMTSTSGWFVAEMFDTGLEHVQNFLQEIPSIKNDAKNKQQRFDNKVTLNQLQKTKNKSSQNEDKTERKYVESIDLINMNNQNER